MEQNNDISRMISVRYVCESHDVELILYTQMVPDWHYFVKLIVHKRQLYIEPLSFSRSIIILQKFRYAALTFKVW